MEKLTIEVCYRHKKVFISETETEEMPSVLLFKLASLVWFICIEEVWCGQCMVEDWRNFLKTMQIK